MPDGNWGTSYDTLLASVATRASRMIDVYTGRQAGAFYVSADTTRYFSGESCVWIGELATAPTTVSVAESGLVDNSANTGGTYTTWSADDYLLWPYNAVNEARPYLRIDVNVLGGVKASFYGFNKGVKIVGKFGYSTTTPDAVKQAAITQSARLFKRGQQGYTDAGAITQLGQVTYLQALDPDVKEIVKHLRTIR